MCISKFPYTFGGVLSRTFTNITILLYNPEQGNEVIGHTSLERNMCSHQIRKTFPCRNKDYLQNRERCYLSFQYSFQKFTKMFTHSFALVIFTLGEFLNFLS